MRGLMKAAFRHPAAAYVAVLAVAVGVRAGVLATLSASAFFRNPVVDAQYHHDWAKALAAERPDEGQRRFLAQPFFKPPLYPYLLGAWYSAFGERVWPVKAAQAVLGALGCVLVLALGRRIFGPGAGLIGGLLAAVYWPWIFFDAWLLNTELVIFLNLLSAWVLSGLPGGGRWRAGAAGLAVGLSAITWPTGLLLAAVLAWWVYRWSGPAVEDAKTTPTRSGGSRRGRLAAAGVFLVAAAAPVGVVASRNMIIAGDAVLISSNGGINFYVGNRPGADGHSAVPTGLQWERLLREEREAGIEKPSESSAYWLRRGLGTVAAEPGRAALLTLKRAALLVNAAEPRNNLSQGYFRNRYRWLGFLPGFGVVGPLAAIGLVLAATGRVKADRAGVWLCVAFVASAFAAAMPFFVCDRFRVVAVPLLLPAAGVGALGLNRAFFGHRPGPLAAYLAAVLGLGMAMGADWFGVAAGPLAKEHFHLGRIHLRDGRSLAADIELQTSLAQADDADAWLLLGRARAMRGDWRGAADAAGRCVALADDAAGGHGLLGVALGRLGRPAKALEHLDRSIALDPQRAGPRLARASAQARAGRRSSARRDLRAASKLLMTAAQVLRHGELLVEASGPDSRPAGVIP